MHFRYLRPTTVAEAVETAARHTSQRAAHGADFIAGGTDLLPLLHEHVRTPDRVVDLTGLTELTGVRTANGFLRLGALTRMSDAATHPDVRNRYPLIAEALLAGASPQVRNLATLGGNLLQRTRCGYFRDPAVPCNKREPGTGCPALHGQNRMHAVFGTSDHCIATYAGDLGNALLAHDAEVEIAGNGTSRTITVGELHRPPGSTPHLETQLSDGEIITAIRVPEPPAGHRSRYLKVRDRAGFEFAVVAVAVVLDLDIDARVRTARVAAGGVATTPWRLTTVEESLTGRELDLEQCEAAAARAAEGAITRGRNDYKVILLRRAVARALAEAGGLR